MIIKNATFDSTTLNSVSSSNEGIDSTTWSSVQGHISSTARNIEEHLKVGPPGSGRLGGTSRCLQVTNVYGKPWGTSSTWAHRSELQTSKGRGLFEGWVAFSLKLYEHDYVNETYYQMHAGSGSPHLTLRTEHEDPSDNFFSNGTRGRLIFRHRLGSGQANDYRTDLFNYNPAPLNEWIDFVMYYRLSETNGAVKVWINRELKYERYGKTTHSDVTNPNHKFGIYKSKMGSFSRSGQYDGNNFPPRQAWLDKYSSDPLSIPEKEVRYHEMDMIRVADEKTPDTEIFEQLDPLGRRALTGIDYGVETYSVTANSNIIGAGSLFGAGTYSVGQTVNMSAIANEGYSFVEWRRNNQFVSSNPNYSFTMQNENVAMTAIFETVQAPDNLIYPVKSVIV